MKTLQPQPGFFDIERRAEKLSAIGDPLVKLKAQMDWEAFRADLNRVHEKKERKSAAGAKPIDVVLKFKMLVLQHLYNLADEGIEYRVRDRISFMRFLGRQLEDSVPDAKTLWVFREAIKDLGLMQVLFERLHEQLGKHGYVAQKGQMIDATFVEVPRQRNSRKENDRIKAGEPPEDWPQAKARQKDVDARWTKKNGESFYGFKSHINADEANKLIQASAVTDASVHDSRVIDELLDHGETPEGNKRPSDADSAYRSEERETERARQGLRSEIHEKGARNHPLTEQQKESNRVKSKVRARVEHIFGAQAQMGGHWVRTIGLARAKVKIGMMNLVYNMKRLGQLLKRDGGAHHGAMNGKVAPVMA